MSKIKWRKYTFEFLSIFVAVVSAFALNNWNDNRRENKAEEKILLEISSGLEKDLVDVAINKAGHIAGIESCKYWRGIIENHHSPSDSLQLHYIQLTRDFTALQNVSGYETLKSRGLELISNDELRSELISLYEYDYYTLRKLEEDYEEMQFHRNYFHAINDLIAPYFQFDEKGNLAQIAQPIAFSEQERNLMLSYLMKIEVNRRNVLSFYSRVEKRIASLKTGISAELK